MSEIIKGAIPSDGLEDYIDDVLNPLDGNFQFKRDNVDNSELQDGKQVVIGFNLLDVASENSKYQTAELDAIEVKIMNY